VEEEKEETFDKERENSDLEVLTAAPPGAPTQLMFPGSYCMLEGGHVGGSGGGVRNKN